MNKGLRQMFSLVSGRYELVNHLLTFGLDILWRRRAARLASTGGGRFWLDVCSGTGEMASYLSLLAREETLVIALDFSAPMLRRARSKKRTKREVFVLADAASLPFQDGVIDLITISFATRNLETSPRGLVFTLKEFHRVLTPHGRLIMLETSQPQNRLFRRIFHLYVRLAIHRVGYLVSGSRTGYRYLSETIQRFHEANRLAEILKKAGFPRVSFRTMLFGAIALHEATKGDLCSHKPSIP